MDDTISALRVRWQEVADIIAAEYTRMHNGAFIDGWTQCAITDNICFLMQDRGVVIDAIPANCMERHHRVPVSHAPGYDAGELIKLRGEIGKVQAFFGYGAEDNRWRPGESAVDALIREITETRKDRDHWKSNHDNQVAIKHAVLDRPDLGDRARSVVGMSEELEALRQAVAELGKPVPMILECPHCHEPHVDKGEWATKRHRTHRCEYCEQEWRPADICTVGVLQLGERRHV